MEGDTRIEPDEVREQEIQMQNENVIINKGAGAVNSVNGKTGDVVLTTSDLQNTSDYQTGSEVTSAIETAIGQIDIPTNVSELTNDSGYQNAQQVASAVAGEASLREAADTNLQGQIDAISASSDVTDIVGTYAELQAYDTSKLKDNDIIKVLQDESQNGETTYYRWSTTTQTLTLIGEEGPYYTKGQADAQFVAQTTYATDKSALEASISTKQNTLTAGTNVSITGDVISATDTTYSPFTGTDGQTAGTAGLVPAPATTDADKFLKSDGTWGTTGGGGPTVVQTTGTSQTDVMSQEASTRMVHAPTTWSTILSLPETGKSYNTNRSSVILLPSNSSSMNPTNPAQSSVVIGGQNSSNNTVSIGVGSSSGSNAVAIGRNANGNMQFATCIGGSSVVRATRGTALGSGSGETNSARVNAEAGIAIGFNSVVANTATGGIALGAGSSASVKGEINVTATGYATTYGYGGTEYRVIRGVHDGEQAHDAINLGQLNSRIVGSGTAAPTSSTAGSVGSLYAYVESGTGHLSICTAVDTTDPDDPVYSWQTLV